MDFEGKVAIVTGGAGHIGTATASELASRGAAVVVADLDEDKARELAEAIGQAGGRAIGVGVDVADEASVVAMIDATVETFGGLDILHNNAAALHLLAGDADVTELEVDTWDQAMAVNARGVFLGCKHAIPKLIERGGGVIVNTSAGASERAEPCRYAYSASKAAVNALTRNIAVQYGRDRIRCVAILPGIILPDEVADAIKDTDFAKMFVRNTPISRMGRPEDIAKFVAFLASDDASFLTGHLYTIDGGITAATPNWSELYGKGTGIF